MKKAFDQTVRDLKRGVNKKVLKVPSIEQKVLDATSNEPWGPHGSLLADIAQATRNYHEYQMIMSVIWKRTNDTGKNWRHVYKALTVLEYLVGHGSERVIDDIREHAYQISTLSDFQYIDSSGKDQGNNVRKKSQSLVVLVNDKDRIQEVRQKAAANRDKYRNTPTGTMYRPGSGGYGDRYDDDRHEGRYRDDDRNGYGRERDDDRYGREGDRYNRDNEERYGRDGYRDDENRGRGQNTDDYQYGSRSRSADPERNRADEDDGQYSSRGSGAKTEDPSQDGSNGKGLARKYSEQSLGAPPSYEDAVGTGRSPTYSERDGESSTAYAPKASSPPVASPSHSKAAAASPPASASPPVPASAQSTAQPENKEVDGFDEFDPRGSFSAAPAASTAPAPATSAVEMDLLGSLSESFSSNSLALVPSTTPEANANSGSPFDAAQPTPTANNQPFDDPFGDGPFRAVPSADASPFQQQITTSNSFNTNSSQSLNVPQPVATTEAGDTFNDAFNQQDLSTPNQNQDIDILADILPPSGTSSFANTQAAYPAPPTQSVPHSGFPPQTNQTSYPLQSSESVPQTGFANQTMALTFPGQASQMGFHSQSGSAQPNQPNPNFYGNYQSVARGGSPAGYMVPPSSTGPPTTQQKFLSQSSQMSPPQVQSSMVSSSAIVPQPSKDKFETKSTVWADTLSRGLVDLNISGSKTNPLSDIGVDFDAINRREKRMEKPTTSSAAVTSTITMGKAMGSGSGMGRAGAGALRPQPNPMAGSGGSMGMGMGMGMNGGNMGMGMGMGMNGGGNMGMGMSGGGNMGMGGGYGASQQPMGRGMGMGMNMPGNNMGMGMNMPGNMGMGMNMQQPMGFPPGSNMPAGYNSTMGTGNYGQQPPYGGGGGYR